MALSLKSPHSIMPVDTSEHFGNKKLLGKKKKLLGVCLRDLIFIHFI